MSTDNDTAKMDLVRVCHSADLDSGDARGYTLALDRGELEVVVAMRGEFRYAYVNSCPHTGPPLNWLPDRFLDNTGQFLQCSTHFALFEVDTGLCVQGPCHGQSLRKLELCERDGWLYVDLGPKRGN